MLLRPALADRAELTFDTPDSSWASGTGGSPVVNAFLHRIAEDAQARGQGWIDRRNDRGRVVARLPAPRTYLVSYLVTAWASDVELEHALLGSVLRALAATERADDLATAEFGVSITVAGSDRPRAPVDLWSALDIPPRAGLDVVVSAPLPADAVTDLAASPEQVDLGMRPRVPEPANSVPTETPRRHIREGT